MYSDFLVINLAAFSCDLEVTFDEIVVIVFLRRRILIVVAFLLYSNVSC